MAPHAFDNHFLITMDNEVYSETLAKVERNITQLCMVATAFIGIFAGLISFRLWNVFESECTVSTSKLLGVDMLLG